MWVHKITMQCSGTIYHTCVLACSFTALWCVKETSMTKIILSGFSFQILHVWCSWYTCYHLHSCVVYTIVVRAVSPNNNYHMLWKLNYGYNCVLYIHNSLPFYWLCVHSYKVVLSGVNVLLTIQRLLGGRTLSVHMWSPVVCKHFSCILKCVHVRTCI